MNNIKKLIFILLILFNFYCCNLLAAQEKQQNENVMIVTHMYEDVLEKLNPNAVEKYFSKQYIQETNNNKPLNYEGFYKHVEGLKENLRSIKILPFYNIVTCGDYVVVRYDVSAITKKGEKVNTRLIAIWKIADGKIINNWEVSSIPAETVLKATTTR